MGSDRAEDYIEKIEDFYKIVDDYKEFESEYDYTYALSDEEEPDI